MIAVSGISKRFDGRVAVDDVSFELRDGESVVVQGPSGSGKTTLLRLIAGLEVPDRGEIRFDGRVVSAPGTCLEPHRRDLGFVFAEPALWPHMSVDQHVRFGLQHAPRAEAEARARALVALLSLAGLERRYPHELSSGEARRVAIARSLAPSPRRLLLDEPLVHLDDALRRDILRAIVRHAAERAVSLVYVTHDSTEAASVASRVLVMRAGRLEASSASPT